MAYAAKDYGKLIGMPGFSETLLKNHFTLYQGYVTNTNKLLDTLAPCQGWQDRHSRVCRVEATAGIRIQRDESPRVLLREPRREGRARQVGQAGEETGRGVRQLGELGEGLQGHRHHEGHRLGHPLSRRGHGQADQPVDQRT